MEEKAKIVFETIKELRKENKYLTVKDIAKKLKWNKLTVEKYLSLILRGLVKIVDKKKGVIESSKLRKLLISGIKDFEKVTKAKMIYEMAKQYIKTEYEDDDVILFISSIYLVSIDEPSDKEIELALKYRGFGAVLGYLANIIIDREEKGYTELKIPAKKKFYVEQWVKTIVKSFF